MYHVISHIHSQNGIQIYGPFHVLVLFLQEKKKMVNVVKLPLELDGEYSYQTPTKSYINKEVKHASTIKKYLFDLFFLFRYILENKIKKDHTIIAIDPLNSFLFSIFKPLIKYRLIYYTVDYSDLRFNSLLLNKIYNLLDLFALKYADANWCVSETIVELREKQGFKAKAYFVPNTPVLSFLPQEQDLKYKNNLVYVGRIDENMNLIPLLQATLQLRKNNRKIKLEIIGGGSLDKKVESFIKKNNMTSYVRFYGPLENSEVIEVLKKSGVGIALYSGGNSWNLYGDSMKIREYQYMGLPVVTTDIPSNSREITRYKCGVVLDSTQVSVESIVESIEKILKSYSNYSRNTFSLVKKRDKNKLFKKLLDI